MKRTIFTLLAGFAIAAAFSSCSKDYTCECVATMDGQELTRVETTINDKKSAAEDKCNEGDASLMGMTTECEIK